MGIKPIPFKASHLELAEFGGKYARGYLDVPGGRDKILALAEASECMTFMYDGRILCFAGVLLCWEGVAEMWVTPTKYIEDHPLIYCRLMKKYLVQLESTMQLVRIQSSSIANAEYDAWMEFLGFVKEGTMKNYTGVGNDYCMWARIKNG